MNEMKTIKHYRDSLGRDFYQLYLKSMKDTIAKRKIASRVSRMATGNYGDHKPLREGVWELKIDQGPGYRVYYSEVKREIVLLLLAGDKRNQDADIATSIEYLKDYLKGE